MLYVDVLKFAIAYSQRKTKLIYTLNWLSFHFFQRVSMSLNFIDLISLS